MIENWNMKFWIEVFSKFESLSKISMRLNDEFFLKVIVSELFKVKGQLYVNIQNVGIQTFLHWIAWQCTNWGTSVQSGPVQLQRFPIIGWASRQRCNFFWMEFMWRIWTVCGRRSFVTSTMISLIFFSSLFTPYIFIRWSTFVPHSPPIFSPYV